MSQANDQGDPSGSKRSKYSAATVLSFHQDDQGRNIVQAVKNRFGRHNAAVEVHYQPELARITEGRMLDADEFDFKKKIKTITRRGGGYDPSRD